jgi:hypothetical protein
MRLLHSASIALAIIGAAPAAAGAFPLGSVAEPTGAVIEIAQHCTCTGGYVPSGGNPVCTSYDCHEVLVFAPTPLKQVRGARDCPRSRILVCDFGSCKLACDPNKK